MTRRNAETADPMNVKAALRAIRHPRLELALEVGLHLEELEPQYRVDRDRVGPSTTNA
jgi:hypothetical protein